MVLPSSARVSSDSKLFWLLKTFTGTLRVISTRKIFTTGEEGELRIGALFSAIITLGGCPAHEKYGENGLTSKKLI